MSKEEIENWSREDLLAEVKHLDNLYSMVLNELDIVNKKLEKINAIAKDDIKTINEILKESDLNNISDKRGLLNYEKELMSRINKLSIIGGE